MEILHARVPESNSRIPSWQSLGNISLNHMAINSETYSQRTEKEDGPRRRTYSYVSHDLRNPLAIINGYIDTSPIKGDNLPRRTKD